MESVIYFKNGSNVYEYGYVDLEHANLHIKKGGFVFRLCKLLVYILKDNALAVFPFRHPAYPVRVQVDVGDRLLGRLRRVPFYSTEKAALARRLRMRPRFLTGLFYCGPVFSRLLDVCLQALFLRFLLFGFWQYLFPPSST